jgi:hypothetical protein
MTVCVNTYGVYDATFQLLVAICGCVTVASLSPATGARMRDEVWMLPAFLCIRVLPYTDLAMDRFSDQSALPYISK